MMIVKQIIDEDFVNYKKPAMYIAFPHCSGKCEYEAKNVVCQNSQIRNQKNIEVSIDDIIQRYIDNNLTEAIVISGLEPFEDFEQLYNLIDSLRNNYHIQDDVIIYTGYYLEEVIEDVKKLFDYSNVIIKFGRYIANMPAIFDPTLGIKLASKNQHAQTIEQIKYMVNSRQVVQRNVDTDKRK